MFRKQEPVCWWCDEPAQTRRVLVQDPEHECWFHRACRKEYKHEERKYRQKAAAYVPPPRKKKAPTNRPPAKKPKATRRKAA